MMNVILSTFGSEVREGEEMDSTSRQFDSCMETSIYTNLTPTLEGVLEFRLRLRLGFT